MFGQVGGKRGQEGVVNNFSRCYGDVSPNLFVNNKFHFSSSATAPSAPLRVRNSTTVDLLGMGYWCPVSMSNKIFVRVGQPREQPLGVCSLCPQNSANAGGMPLFDHFHVFPPSPPLHVFSFVSRTHLSIPFANNSIAVASSHSRTFHDRRNRPVHSLVRMPTEISEPHRSAG